MYENRRNKLTNTDTYNVIMVDSPENLYYYTGFTGGEAVLIMLCAMNGVEIENDCFIITDSRYYEQVEKECPDVVLIKLEGKTYIEAIKQLLNDKLPDNLGGTYLKLAIEDTMKLSMYLKLKEALKGFEISVDSEFISMPRRVKGDK